MATICFVCEGAYPYVVGGVSAWVHELITSNPQHDFKILCIIPDEKFAKLKYQIPKNVVEIKNIFMDSSLDFSYSSFIKAGLQENEEKKDTQTKEEKEKEENTKSTWTKAEFDALKEGDILKKGAGGTNYEDVIRDHGKPTDETTSTVSGSELKTITYLPGGSKYQAVILTFSKNEDGSFLLTSKIGTGLE